MNYRHVVISVTATAEFLRETYRELATAAMVQYQGRGYLNYNTVVFDPVPFLIRLVEDIGRKDETCGRLGQSPDSTIAILTQVGVPVDTARWLYHQAWEQIHAQIIAYLPEADSSTDWQYSLCSGYDLVVMCPCEEDLRQARVPTIMDEIYDRRIAESHPTPAGSRLSWSGSWLLPVDHSLPSITSADIDAQFRADYARGT